MADSQKLPQMINVGTKEAPILIPADVASGVESPISERWWQGVVTGSIIVKDNILNKLLGINDEKK